MKYPVFVRTWIRKTTHCAGTIEWDTTSGPWLTIIKHWESVHGTTKMQFELRLDQGTGARFLFGSCPDEELEQTLEAIRRLGEVTTQKAPKRITDELAGAIAYQLTKRLVIDMPTARAAGDEAIKRTKDSV